MTVCCDRCGVPGLVRGQSTNPDARLLKHAQTAAGLCANCAMTAWLLGVEPIRMAIEDNGPAILLDPRVQQQVAAVCATGRADMRPEEINWETVVQNWDLPFRRARRFYTT